MGRIFLQRHSQHLRQGNVCFEVAVLLVVVVVVLVLVVALLLLLAVDMK